MATPSSSATSKAEMKSSAVSHAIQDLLDLCKEKNVEVPDRLESALQSVLTASQQQEEAEEEIAEAAASSGVTTKHTTASGRIIPFRERLKSDHEEILAELEQDPFMVNFIERRTKFKEKKADTTVRVKNGSFKVTTYHDENDNGRSIKTVYNSSKIYALRQKFQRMWRNKSLMDSNHLVKKERMAMKKVNLFLEPGNTYVVLGAPRSGKSTLLKMIAGILQEDVDHEVGGTVELNAFTRRTPGVFWSNCVGYIDQIDRLHPFLTVKETLEFAWRCRQGQTHKYPLMEGITPDLEKEIQQMDKELFAVTMTMQGVGLTRVADTFVGDQQTVRGVSGGEKKRVTVAEMGVGRFPVLCMDEISTGLDAATTYDICKLIREINDWNKHIKIVSLLQPPPETFAVFDGLILVSEGQIIYSGPVDQVVSHFESLGYTLPDRMDVADWLQAIPTKDGKDLLTNPESKHLTSEEFCDKFYESALGKEILSKLEQPLEGPKEDNGAFKEWMSLRYRNSSYESLKLLVMREMLLWWRDKTQIRARILQDLVMGIIAGTLFWQGWEDPTSVMGILFQSMFFVSVGAMLKVAPQYEVRGIYYKHQDANFFPTWSYVVGKSLASVPASIIDGLVYGTIIFWFVGLAFNEGATIANYFMFMLLILSASVTIGLLFSIFPSITPDKSTGQAYMSVSTLLLVLFSGYTVQPDVIPGYWVWFYWFNSFAWALRGLAVNEFDSGKYDGPSDVEGLTQGEAILTRFGFVQGNGDPYTFEWAWWSILYSTGLCIFAVLTASICLKKIRFATGKSLANDSEEEDEELEPPEPVDLPFQKVNLTFRDVHYTVTSSVGNERLELLKGIDGVIEAGKMTALMGSSGAGKTTLMDVLAMRKTSGEIEGEICLNGHPQEENSFRRCTGYVEQFDVQSAQLTIRETCVFSAKLRLDAASPSTTPEAIEKFVDQTLFMLELTNIQDLQVGDDDSGGLSFEQKKRLSIAVELVANPSIIFLDEPTSGLDARAAAIVMRGLERIAKSGRAVCATIHQPSIAIFNSFDALLLLKRGGETVFFGNLGTDSCNLIDYLERYESTARIQPGENPATWMLTTIGAGSATTDVKPFDYAGSYHVSDLHKTCLQRIEAIMADVEEEGKVSFPSVYATTLETQVRVVMERAFKIYMRSPSYNQVRVIVAAVLALLIGSVYVTNRTPTNESDMNSRATTIFVAYLFIAVNSLNTVLAFFEKERNMFYRHKSALMYDNSPILLAFTAAEAPFIILCSFIYVSIFYFMIGFTADAGKYFIFWFFMLLNMANFTFLGQMYVSLTRDSVTAQGFGGLTISLTSLFTGVLIRPDNIPAFWSFMYWLMPGHYIFEGLLASQFQGDDTPIEASPGTPFWDFLGCSQQFSDGAETCIGSAEDWVFASFGGNFVPENIPWNILYLCGLLIVSRIATALALKHLNFRST